MAVVKAVGGIAMDPTSLEGLLTSRSYEEGSLRGNVAGMSCSLGGVELYADGVYWLCVFLWFDAENAAGFVNVCCGLSGREEALEDHLRYLGLREALDRD